MITLKTTNFSTSNIIDLEDYRKGGARRRLCSSLKDSIRHGISSIVGGTNLKPTKEGEITRFKHGQQTIALRNLLFHTINNYADAQIRLDLSSAFTTFEGVLRLFEYSEDKISEISKKINEDNYTEIINRLIEQFKTPRLIDTLIESGHRINLYYGFNGIKLNRVPYTQWFGGLTASQIKSTDGNYLVSTIDPDLVELFSHLTTESPLSWNSYLNLWKSFHGIHIMPLCMKASLYLFSEFQKKMIRQKAKGTLSFEPIDLRYYDITNPKHSPTPNIKLDLYSSFCRTKEPLSDAFSSTLQLADSLKPKKVQPYHQKPIVLVQPEEFILVHDSTLNHSGAKTGNSWDNGGPVSIYSYNHQSILKQQGLLISQTLTSSNLMLTDPSQYNPSRLLFEALRWRFLTNTNEVDVLVSTNFDPFANKNVQQATINFLLPQTPTASEVAA